MTVDVRYSHIVSPSAAGRLTALLLLLCGLTAAQPVELRAERVRLQRVSFTERSDGNGYVVRMHTNRSPDAFTEERLSGTEVLLTIYDATVASDFRQDRPRGPVTDYSAVEQGTGVTIRLQLSSDRSIETSTYPDAGSDDLLLSLTYDTSEKRPAAVVDNSSSEQPYVLSREAREKWKLDCVVIDPGHGGHDPGAHGNGVREKDVVLDVALKLGHYVQKYLDLRVVYTRRTDRFVPLHERGRIANEKCGKLFVSIHANSLSSSRSRVHGTETYILGLHKTDQARKVMERENSVIELENNPGRYEEVNEDELVVQSLAQNMYMRESEILAEKIQSQFKNRAMRHSRGIKQAGFLVLWRASMPAVLVELGFVTNPREAAYLESEKGQTYLASAIFRAVRSYKAEYEKGLDFAAEE